MSDPERTSGTRGSSPYDEPTGTFRIPPSGDTRHDSPPSDASDHADDSGVYGYEPYRRESDHPQDTDQARDTSVPATTAIPTSSTATSPRTKALGVDRDAFHREHNRYAMRDGEPARPRAYADVDDSGFPDADEPETRVLNTDRAHRHEGTRHDDTRHEGVRRDDDGDGIDDPDGRDDAVARSARRRRERRRDEYDDESFRGNVADVARARRGTTDLGLLVLRVAVGLIAMAHGSQKLFGWWGGPRLSGFEAFLTNVPNPDIGFASDAVTPLAIVGALSESLGGLMLVIGLLTPIAGSAVLGVMIVAATYKATLAGGVWFFAQPGGGGDGGRGPGIEYEILIGVAAAAVILSGPGRLSLDFGRGWATRPFVGSVAWLAIGIAAPVVVWILLNGTNPFTSPGNPTPG